jgi:WD40 repeat protein
LTGSSDTTIKAWDALSGTCLRTYEGHNGAVTGLSLGAATEDATEGSTTFISSSADKSVKCWVLTAVSYRDPAAALDHILDIHENTCRCFDAAT